MAPDPTSDLKTSSRKTTGSTASNPKMTRPRAALLLPLLVFLLAIVSSARLAARTTRPSAALLSPLLVFLPATGSSPQLTAQTAAANQPPNANRPPAANQPPNASQSSAASRPPDASHGAATQPDSARRATATEEVRLLDTYPYSDPNPVPILARDPRLYPYHSFQGYSATSEPREWKVITLENDLIQVFVLPEVGGKVWGAIVKATGHEFIYRNEVMKFRNISLRGPWTSGGIEFNFGVIGHTPATATPVDYALRENADGSASVFVGTMDLPSRTHWRVEVRLPPDKAYFETRTLWYNPTPLVQPYYNWMTAAAFARDDLELFVPGKSYLEHSGRERSWPHDEAGRHLPTYGNNDFGGHKSYHVVGELNDFFGGYYHDEDWGWGHWARHEDMPGQKLWLWSLSRAGGIWEELLTDTDGQYVEFQAGRLLVQYSPGGHANPVTQAGFDPLSSSRWDETWFPVEGTGGLTDVSREGAMHIRAAAGRRNPDPASPPGDARGGERGDEGDARGGEGGKLGVAGEELGTDRIRVAVNAFGAVEDTLEVWSGDRRIAATPVRLAALEPFEAEFDLPTGDEHFRVRMKALGLDYDSDDSGRTLSRPFEMEPGLWAMIPRADSLVFEAQELYKARRFGPARALFESALEEEPWNRDALLGMAELDLRSARYEEGLEHAKRALQLDTYDARANFLAGNLYLALGRAADARDSFGWSARSMEFRAASYVRLAELMTGGTPFLSAGASSPSGEAQSPSASAKPPAADASSRSGSASLSSGDSDWEEVKRYAQLALDFDRNSVPAWQLLALQARVTGNENEARRARAVLLKLDPLHHFVLAEEYLADPGTAARQRLLDALRSEYPDQTLLELAAGYAGRGLVDDALAALEIADRHHGGPVARAWRAFLSRDPQALDEPGDPAFAFPFRPESLPVLRWAAERSAHWIWRYLVGLNLWALDREEEAAKSFESLGGEPDYGPAYAARAHLLNGVLGRDPAPDLARAVELDPGSRPLRIALIRQAQNDGRWSEALDASATALETFPGDFDLELLHVRALLHADRPLEAAAIMDRIHVLPSENSGESHRLYEQAHISVALDELERGGGMEADAVGGDPAARRPAGGEPAGGGPSEAVSHLEAALEWPESLGLGRPYDPDERLARYLLGVAADESGDEETARLAFEAVAAATPDIAGGPATSPSLGRAALPSILALHALGRRDILASIAGNSDDGVADDPADAGAVSGAQRPLSAGDEAALADQLARELAAALTDPETSVETVAARLVARYAPLFEDMDGRLLARTLLLPRR